MSPSSRKVAGAFLIGGSGELHIALRGPPPREQGLQIGNEDQPTAPYLDSCDLPGSSRFAGGSYAQPKPLGCLGQGIGPTLDSGGSERLQVLLAPRAAPRCLQTLLSHTKEPTAPRREVVGHFGTEIVLDFCREFEAVLSSSLDLARFSIGGPGEEREGRHDFGA